MTTLRKLADIRRDIHASSADIIARSGVDPATTFPRSPSLLGSGTKTRKGEAVGILTAVVYLAPATAAFQWEGAPNRTTCSHAGECACVCLGEYAGLLAMPHTRNAKDWKVALFMGARRLYRELLLAESLAFSRKAARLGMVPAIRPDGSSDTGEGSVLAATLWAMRDDYPEAGTIEVYDYTKVPGRAIKWARGGYTPNYSVTFSRGGDNDEAVARVLAEGANVAAVFSARPGNKLRAGDPLPEAFRIRFPDGWRVVPVVSGDATDARFLDTARGSIIGLSFKQKAARAAALVAAGEFVVAMDDTRVIPIAPQNALQAA